MDILYLQTGMHIPAVAPMRQDKPTTIAFQWVIEEWHSLGLWHVVLRKMPIGPQNSRHGQRRNFRQEMLEQCGFATPEKWLWPAHDGPMGPWALLAGHVQSTIWSSTSHNQLKRHAVAWTSSIFASYTPQKSSRGEMMANH